MVVKPCAFCPESITGPYFQLVQGWVANGKRDSLCLRQDVDPAQYAHPHCVKLQQLGVVVGQEALSL